MRARPISLRAANAYVAEHHRHHGPTRGHKFSIGAEHEGRLVGVAIVGRPVARALDDGTVAEVLRVCTDGTRNACSFLYARCWAASKAMGYDAMVTYTLADSESGASVRAAGGVLDGHVRGREWSCISRPRQGVAQSGDKVRWRWSS